MTYRERNSLWFSWLAFLSGVWLIIAPAILGYASLSTATNNDIVIGTAVALLAFVTAVWGRTTGWLGFIIAVLGLWEIVAPFALGYSANTNAVLNQTIVGILITAFGAARALTSTREETTTAEYGPAYFSEERPENRNRETSVVEEKPDEILEPEDLSDEDLKTKEHHH